jgi:steroid delta-isomerase-like uncharacterized protein
MNTRLAVTRRRALIRLGTGGVALGLAASVRGALAQESTPVLPRSVPPELETWAAGWEEQDPAQIASAYAEDAVVRIVPFDTVREGVPAIEDYFTTWFGAFAEATVTIGTAFATAEYGAAEWFLEGRYVGQLPGLPMGEGQPVAQRGANILTLTAGRISTEAIYTDLAALLVQIGVIEATVPGVEVPATPAG